MNHVLETERGKRHKGELPSHVDWINDQTINPNSLEGIKVGILGLGHLATQIAKAFKVIRRNCKKRLGSYI